MKKFHFILSLLPALAFCGTVSAQQIRTESIELKNESALAEIDIQAELPVPGQGAAAARIRKQLIDVVDGLLATRFEENGKERVFPAFSGDTDNSAAWADYYRRKTVETIEKEAREQRDDFGEEDWDMTYGWALEKTFETESIVVFNSGGWMFSSGMAHPGTFGRGSFTFDKTDGHLVGQFLKPTVSERELQPLIRKGLREYFEVSDNDLNDELLIDGDLIPLPQQALSPSQDGLVFTYLTYEISYGLAGEPEFTVSYEKILPYLTAEAKRLFFGDTNSPRELSPKSEPEENIIVNPTILALPKKGEEVVPLGLVERKPSFNGGDFNSFSKWVNSHLEYPETAKENGVQGRVTVTFTISADGFVENVQVLRGVDSALDKEAVRLVSGSPRWTPGVNNGYRIPVTVTFPIIFQLR